MNSIIHVCMNNYYHNFTELQQFQSHDYSVSDLRPNCVVLVASIRALKMHGGGPNVTSGQPLDPVYSQENIPLLEEGFSNLHKHIENAMSFGVPVVVAINVFSSDTSKELDLVQKLSRDAGAFDAIICSHWANGGRGAKELGEAVMKACSVESQFEFLYPLNIPLKVLTLWVKR